MTVKMNDAFRARELEFKTQDAIDSTNPLDYFIDALGSERLAKALRDICRARSVDLQEGGSSGPGQRFVDMVWRDNDVSRWIDFLRHEQKREESRWSKGPLRTLPDALKEWQDSLTKEDQPTQERRDGVVRKVEETSGDLFSERSVEDCIRMRNQIGLRAFRTMLWRLRRGGEEE